MSSDPPSLTPAERELIRHEFGQRFGQYPSLAEGIFLRLWRTGPRAGQPKIPKAMEGLLARGLMTLPPEPPSILGTRARFTPAGLEALRALLRDRRAMDPERFAHLRRELGIDPPGEAAATEPNTNPPSGEEIAGRADPDGNSV